MRSLPPKHFVDAAGNYLGPFVGIDREDGYTDQDGKVIPSTIEQPRPTVLGAVEVPTPPAHGRDTWDGAKWVPYTPPVKTLDEQIAERDDVLKAVIELVPGGMQAVKAKLGEMRGQ